MNPPANSNNAAENADITADLDDIAAEVNENSFIIHGSYTGKSPGVYGTDENTLFLDPTSDFMPGETVQATITSDITSGGTAVTPYVWKYRTTVKEGHGYFSEGIFNCSIHNSYGITLGDTDNDGDLDIVVSDSHTELHLNDGFGNFTESGQDLGFAPHSLNLCDLDNDGDLDLFGSGPSNPAYVQFNNAGVFTDSGQSIGSGSCHDVCIGDLNGDGYLDAFLAKTSNNYCQVFLNDGTGYFTDTGFTYGNRYTARVRLGDLDADGDLDAFLAEAGQNIVLLNDGNGIFTVSEQTFPSHPDFGLDLGDVDADGDLDAVIGGIQNVTSRVLLNNGSGLFSDSGQSLGTGYCIDVKLGDLDGDGDLDAYLVFDGLPNKICLNDGTGIFTPNSQVLANGTSRDAALGDLDGDGDLDAVVANSQYDWDNKIWFNEVSPPTPTPTITPTPTATPPCFHTGDVNQSGTISAEDAQLVFYIVLGLYTPSWEENCAADCNGDSIITAQDAQQVFYLIMGTGSCVDPLL